MQSAVIGGAEHVRLIELIARVVYTSHMPETSIQSDAHPWKNVELHAHLRDGHKHHIIVKFIIKVFERIGDGEGSAGNFEAGFEVNQFVGFMDISCPQAAITKGGINIIVIDSLNTQFVTLVLCGKAFAKSTDKEFLVEEYCSATTCKDCEFIFYLTKTNRGTAKAIYPDVVLKQVLHFVIFFFLCC